MGRVGVERVDARAWDAKRVGRRCQKGRRAWGVGECQGRSNANGDSRRDTLRRDHRKKK